LHTHKAIPRSAARGVSNTLSTLPVTSRLDTRSRPRDNPVTRRTRTFRDASP
jgi:hypothetical protein